MACGSNNNECSQHCPKTGGNGFVCIIVLYILLAIIIGTAFVY